MIISFETRDLERICCILDTAEQRFGSVHAQALLSLIADLEAFNHADEMFEFMGDEIQVANNDSVSAAVGTDYQATFIPVGARFVRDENLRVVWSSVTRLKLMIIKELV